LLCERWAGIPGRVISRKNIKKPLENASPGWYDGVAFLREQHQFSTVVDKSVEK
jgi:hypothetical protein